MKATSMNSSLCDCKAVAAATLLLHGAKPASASLSLTSAWQHAYAVGSRLACIKQMTTGQRKTAFPVRYACL